MTITHTHVPSDWSAPSFQRENDIDTGTGIDTATEPPLLPVVPLVTPLSPHEAHVAPVPIHAPSALGNSKAVSPGSPKTTGLINDDSTPFPNEAIDANKTLDSNQTNDTNEAVDVPHLCGACMRNPPV
jgi:hypothetical protein